MSRSRIIVGVAVVVVTALGYATDYRPTTEAKSALPESAALLPIHPPSRTVSAADVPKRQVASISPWINLEPPAKLRPRLRAESACVVDVKSGSVLYARNAEEARPLASMIKLLTALVYLESGPDLNAEIEITPEDAQGAGKSILWKGHIFRARDVLYAALISSENRAARALARSTRYTQAEFIEHMRVKAAQLGCNSIEVVEPTGLSELNVASAADVARLLIAALSNPTIAKACQTYRYEFKALNKPKLYRLTNSNRLLKSKYRITGGKTGYIDEAGWCLTNRIETSSGPLVTVVMACRSNGSRFSETRQLIEWALKYRPQAHTFALAGGVS